MSEQPKWTPGPWFVVRLPDERGTWVSATEDGNGYRCLESQYMSICVSSVGDDNAHLIAAAPDLYAALELADAALSGASMDMRHVEKKVRAALAKARGQ